MRNIISRVLDGGGTRRNARDPQPRARVGSFSAERLAYQQNLETANTFDYPPIPDSVGAPTAYG